MEVSDSEEADEFTVTCPPECGPGDIVAVEFRGTVTDVLVPDDVGPGDEFVVSAVDTGPQQTDGSGIVSSDSDDDSEDGEEDFATAFGDMAALLEDHAPAPAATAEAKQASTGARQLEQGSGAAGDTTARRGGDEKTTAELRTTHKHQDAKEPGPVRKREGTADEGRTAAIQKSPSAVTVPFTANEHSQEATNGAVQDQLGQPPDALAPMRDSMRTIASVAATPPLLRTDQGLSSHKESSLGQRDITPKPPADGKKKRNMMTQQTLSRLMQPVRPTLDESRSKPSQVKRCGIESAVYKRLTSPEEYTGMYAKRFDRKGRGMGLKNRDEDAYLDLSQVTRPQFNQPAPANTGPGRDATTKPRSRKKRTRAKRNNRNETRRAKVLRKTAVRAGVERDSRKVGTLERGDEVLVLEQTSASDGQPRVRTPAGWVSIVATSGYPILQLMRPVHQKLSDTKLYTGTSRFHFDSSGKGKGLAGKPRDNWSAQDYDGTAPVDLESTLRHSWRGSTHTTHSTTRMRIESGNFGSYYHAPAGTILRTPPHHGAAIPARDGGMHTAEASNKADLVQSHMLEPREYRTPSADGSTTASPMTSETQNVQDQVERNHAHYDALSETTRSQSCQHDVESEPQPELVSHSRPGSMPGGRVQDEHQQDHGENEDRATSLTHDVGSHMVHDPLHNRQEAADDALHDGGGNDGGGTVMEVTVPTGNTAGDTIALEIGDRVLVDIEIPEGLGPGDLFEVEISDFASDADSLLSPKDEKLEQGEVGTNPGDPVEREDELGSEETNGDASAQDEAVTDPSRRNDESGNAKAAGDVEKPAPPFDGLAEILAPAPLSTGDDAFSLLQSMLDD